MAATATMRRLGTVRELDVPVCPRGRDHAADLEEVVTERLRLVKVDPSIEMQEAELLCIFCCQRIPMKLDSRVAGSFSG